jgi:hypothetical protein
MYYINDSGITSGSKMSNILSAIKRKQSFEVSKVSDLKCQAMREREREREREVKLLLIIMVV